VTMPSYTSLFSGCGGFDLGLRGAGFSLRSAYDSDPIAVANFEKNLLGPAFVTDLTTAAQSIPSAGVDLIVAGPPCQGFSTAGKRNVDDDRNELLTLTGELALRARPKVLVVENVSGVLAGSHFRFWQQLEGRMRTAGYQTHTLRLQAAQLGMAQLRQRVFLFCWLTEADFNAMLPTALPAELQSVMLGVSKLPNHDPVFLEKGSRDWQIAQRIKPGQKLCNVRGGDNAVPTWSIPEVFGKVEAKEETVLQLLRTLRRQNRERETGDADPVSYERLQSALGQPFRRIVNSLIAKGFVRKKGHGIDLVGTFNGKYRRLHPKRPSCTVDTRFGSPRYFLHPHHDRGFTVREAARIQGFPDSYVFVGALAAQFRLVGNAVAPPVAAHVAKIVRHLLSA
jgi:DNA (cytosine-5)-methyltransferase 1